MTVSDPRGTEVQNAHLTMVSNTRKPRPFFLTLPGRVATKLVQRSRQNRIYFMMALYS